MRDFNAFPSDADPEIDYALSKTDIQSVRYKFYAVCFLYKERFGTLPPEHMYAMLWRRSQDGQTD